MNWKFRHHPQQLPRDGLLGEYNDSLAIVKEHIHKMQNSTAALEWINEVQRLLNSARRNIRELENKLD